MRLANLLKKHSVVALDTSTFIYQFEQDNRYFSATNLLFNNIQSDKNKGVTTVISLAEILVKPMQLQSIPIIEDYKYVINNFPNLIVVGVDQRVAILAANLRAKYKIKLPDAMQISGGLIKEATLFVTNDKKLKKVKEIEVVTLGDIVRK